ncbi:precorrin-2 C20-methyltransferase / precorrin-3B C17-methyltransferase [Actinopolyspora mzabensis]|uniref:Precorrin-2 C20-methyltransferase / precorrin-3B C17-methyltransferase n=1 Tax=Actinopolyspora mzabensis TaxID=995066 RepID=A0A1G8YUY9_ACTMZ|nr:precorrin-2 C(20)-methyltransferase [Actinopolyspora mzabensis]SDK05790.1 precorrin-2 C20-methyltransferase / precorrin-3B C17-methyltransferase [Actinopolyspora mzabensis]
MSSQHSNDPVPGRLFGVGLGPGDPELVTVKAARLIGAADVVAYHSARHGNSIARSVAEPYLRGDQIEEPLVYPVTTETTDHPGGYQGAIDEFYTEIAGRLAAHLAAGRDVALLGEGDPFFYGSYMHMHKRLSGRFDTEVVPGVNSVSAASAELGRPLAERDEILTVLPGTLEPHALAERLRDTDAAAVLKLGRTFEGVREAFEKAGCLDSAYYVERASTRRQRVEKLGDVDPESVPYFSLALLPSPVGEASGATGASEEVRSGTGSGPGGLSVVGLGPAGREWTTPEAQAALGAADDLVGYGPYLDRIPSNPRQRKHPSDNRVEAERAAAALELAATGREVVVVSSGDPGVFAMASAVLEAATDPAYEHVNVRVLPGLTAAQAVASRAGAPLGHDYCVLSLSDRLKPWSVIEQRLEAAASADLAMAVYNPASASRRWQVGAARDTLLRHRAPETPVVIGRDIGGAEEDVRIVRLDELDPEQVDMRCLLLVGSSTSRVVERSDGATVFTPRRYPA